MANLVGTNLRVRFKAFELDLHTRELYRNGIRLRVQGQPIDVLEMLLESPGELVTREQLRKKLWPEDTFVDFEHSLNSTIARLRDALGDHAEDPRFIETLPRLGYRFIAPVENPNGRVPATLSSTGYPPPSMLVLTDTTSMSEGASAIQRTWLQRWRWALAVGVVLALGITAACWEWWSVYPVPHVTSIDRITNDGVPKMWPVTDGGRVYYTENVNSGSVLAQVSSAGGESSTIPMPFTQAGAVADISPDHGSLLLTDGGPLWIFPLPQGPPRKVGDVIADDADWTADGKQILFTRGGELWISDADGSQMRKLWKSPGSWAVTPRLSPDRKHIRLSACWQSGCALWEVNPDGTGAQQVLPGWQDVPAQDAGGWSPDGRYYVFGAITERGAFHENIWVLPERRGWRSGRHAAPVQLTRGPLCFFPSFAFSRDGHTLFAVGKKDDSELVRYDPKTHKAAPFLPGIPATLVDFSRDGQWVVYTTTPYASLWRSRRDGSERVQLASNADLLAGIARWSPDGTRIAFERRPVGGVMYPGKAKLALISRDGGIPEQVISDEEDSLDQGDPTWSPDGNQIIFARDWIRRSEERMELLRVDLRTRKVTPVPGSEGLFSPRWSRDGHLLAAITIDMRTIRLFDFQRQIWTTWFTAQQEVGSNLWSEDGNALYFLNRKTKDSPLAWWRIGLGERTPTKIMELPTERILGWWYGLEPDGSSSYFTRDLTSTEIYAIHLSEKKKLPWKNVASTNHRVWLYGV